MNRLLNISCTWKTFTLFFFLTILLPNYQYAFCAEPPSEVIAQTPNPRDLPPERFNDIPVDALPSEIVPPPSHQDQLLPTPQLPEQPIPGQDDPNAKFQVDRIEVVGSTVFTPEQFAAITTPFVGREITFAELLQIRDAITKLYTDNGYVTTGALIAPQILEAGVVKIQVIEGTLAEIKITGNRRLQSPYISDRIRLGAAKPLNIPRLLESLQLLRLNPRIQNLSAELQSGVTPGTNILQVEVQEADTF
ncbi:MAG: POTRA domain-containing protein, partial [Trichormus sp.]